jgi:hypothetical protein
MKLDEQHPSYAKFLPYWSEMYDAIEGESRIKELGETYLPMPSGMKLMKDKGEASYSAYMARATYPELVTPTIRGLLGVIHNSPLKVTLPDSMMGLVEVATVDGLTLEGMARRITKGVLSYGRQGIAVTFDSNNSPIFAIYDASSILNWNEAIGMVLLDETGYEMDAEFKWEEVERRMLLSTENGVVTGESWKKIGGIWTLEEAKPYRASGNGTTEFPFVFIDCNDLTAEPDEVPLLPLSRLSLKAYRQDANYQQTLYLSSQPQHIIIGMSATDTERPMVVGGGAIWFLPDPQQKAEILEFTGSSATAQRQAIQDTLQMAIQSGARLFATNDEQQESGEARKIKYSAQTATLVSIAKTVASGIEKACKIAGMMMGVNPDDISIEIDTDFIDHSIGSDVMTAIVSSVTGGLLSEQTGYELFQKGGMANPDRTWEEEKDLIDQQEPALGTIGRASTGIPPAKGGLQNQPEGTAKGTGKGTLQ